MDKKKLYCGETDPGDQITCRRQLNSIYRVLIIPLVDAQQSFLALSEWDGSGFEVQTCNELEMRQCCQLVPVDGINVAEMYILIERVKLKPILSDKFMNP